DPQALVPALAGHARFFVESGNGDEAAALLDELLDLRNDYFAAMIDLGWVLHDLDRADALRPGDTGTVWGAAVARSGRGDVGAAAAGGGVTRASARRSSPRARRARPSSSERSRSTAGPARACTCVAPRRCCPPRRDAVCSRAPVGHGRDR